MGKTLRDRYRDSMAIYGFSYALYEPEPFERLRPGTLGCFDDVRGPFEQWVRDNKVALAKLPELRVHSIVCSTWTYSSELLSLTVWQDAKNTVTVGCHVIGKYCHPLIIVGQSCAIFWISRRRISHYGASVVIPWCE